MLIKKSFDFLDARPLRCKNQEQRLDCNKLEKDFKLFIILHVIVKVEYKNLQYASAKKRIKS